MVATSSAAYAVSVGVLSIAVTVPQILISFAVEGTFQCVTKLQIAGYVLAPLAALGFAAERVYLARKEAQRPQYVELNV